MRLAATLASSLYLIESQHTQTPFTDITTPSHQNRDRVNGASFALEVVFHTYLRDVIFSLSLLPRWQLAVALTGWLTFPTVSASVMGRGASSVYTRSKRASNSGHPHDFRKRSLTNKK